MYADLDRVALLYDVHIFGNTSLKYKTSVGKLREHRDPFAEVHVWPCPDERMDVSHTVSHQTETKVE